MITECEQKINNDRVEAETADNTAADESEESADDPQNASSGGMLTLPQIMEQFSDIVTSGNRLEEGYELTCMLKDMPTRIDVDSEWFFLPKDWLDKWEVFNYSDVVTAEPGQPNDTLRSVDRTKPPGRIDFSGLFLQKEDNQLADI